MNTNLPAWVDRLATTVAALYVQLGGVYYGLPGVEPWGLPERDAREYAGPYLVIAHPPCARWGASDAGLRFDQGFHSAEERRRLQRLGTVSQIPKGERGATPEPFRDLLLGIARGCGA